MSSYETAVDGLFMRAFTNALRIARENGKDNKWLKKELRRRVDRATVRRWFRWYDARTRGIEGSSCNQRPSELALVVLADALNVNEAGLLEAPPGNVIITERAHPVDVHTPLLEAKPFGADTISFHRGGPPDSKMMAAAMMAKYKRILDFDAVRDELREATLNRQSLFTTFGHLSRFAAEGQDLSRYTEIVTTKAMWRFVLGDAPFDTCDSNDVILTIENIIRCIENDWRYVEIDNRVPNELDDIDSIIVVVNRLAIWRQRDYSIVEHTMTPARVLKYQQLLYGMIPNDQTGSDDEWRKKTIHRLRNDIDTVRTQRQQTA